MDPSKFLCLTFTNKAANELKDRLRGLLGTLNVPVWAGTFHAFGAWMLRRESRRIGYPPTFAIYDEFGPEIPYRSVSRTWALRGSGEGKA
jgi:DNA helicase-2/ATP-dependent DNA helicase PcrA